MPTLPIYQFSYPRQREELRDETKVLAWMEAIASHGYYLTHRDEAFYEQWYTAVHQQTLFSGLSPQLRETVHAFCQGTQEELSAEAYALSGNFLVGVEVAFPEGYLLLHADDSYFTMPEIGAEQYERFLRLAEMTYRLWHPVYGYDFVPAAYLPYTTREEALALQVRYLYLINLFGPEYVAQLGRERLLSAAAWQIKELDDGGVMLLISAYRKPPAQKSQLVESREVAAHLGLTSALDLVTLDIKTPQQPPENQVRE